MRSRLAVSGVADDEPLAETMILLVSELVTNAVVHTGRPAVLRLSFQGVSGAFGGLVRLEVADLSSCPPAPRHADGDETNGRGLELVDGLADRWGWTPEGAGKRIWCELDRCAAPAPGVATACGGGGGGGGGGGSVAAVTATATVSVYGGMAAYEAV